MFEKAYSVIAGQINSSTGSLISGTYYAAHSILFNGVAYTIIGLIAMFWLMQRLKDNFPKEQLWKAFVWICITAFVFGAFGSITAYKELLTWFHIPASWANDIASSVSGGGNIATKFGNIWDTLNNIFTQTENYVTSKKTYAANTMAFKYEAESWYKPDWTVAATNWLKYAGIWLKLFVFQILRLLIIIMLLAVAAMTLVSEFIGGILLAISPMVVPLIIIPQTRAYFFSWLKLYISVSLYAPLALLVLGIAQKAVKLLANKGGQEMWDSPAATPFPALCMTIIAIYTMMKIPNWIQQIMGASDGSMGSGAGTAMLAATGSVAAMPANRALGTAMGLGSGAVGLAKGTIAKVGQGLGWGAGKIGENTGKGVKQGGKVAQSGGKALMQTGGKLVAAGGPIGWIAGGLTATAGAATYGVGTAGRAAGATVQYASKAVKEASKRRLFSGGNTNNQNCIGDAINAVKNNAGNDKQKSNIINSVGNQLFK